MICDKCGKQLEEGDLFCTECGNSLGTEKSKTIFEKRIKNNKIVDKINAFIEKNGDKEINSYLSIITIIFMVAIRCLGFIVTTVLATMINSFLIYHNFKKNSKIDTKMIAFSLSVLLIGVLIII